jgi:hypothetical protein
MECNKIREDAGQHEVAPVVVKTIKQAAHDNVDQSGSSHRKRKKVTPSQASAKQVSTQKHTFSINGDQF